MDALCTVVRNNGNATYNIHRAYRTASTQPATAIKPAICECMISVMSACGKKVAPGVLLFSMLADYCYANKCRVTFPQRSTLVLLSLYYPAIRRSFILINEEEEKEKEEKEEEEEEEEQEQESE